MAIIIDTVLGNAGRPRHPEKAHRPDQPSQRKPDWIRVKAPVSPGYTATRDVVRANGLHTVCEEAGCPNIGECWEKKHATFMIMGDTCTRACAFCNVRTGLPDPLDPQEPAHVATAHPERPAPPTEGAAPHAPAHPAPPPPQAHAPAPTAHPAELAPAPAAEPSAKAKHLADLALGNQTPEAKRLAELALGINPDAPAVANTPPPAVHPDPHANGAAATPGAPPLPTGDSSDPGY